MESKEKKRIYLGEISTTTNSLTGHFSKHGCDIERIYIKAEELGFLPSQVQKETISGETTDQYGGMYVCCIIRYFAEEKTGGTQKQYLFCISALVFTGAFFLFQNYI